MPNPYYGRKMQILQVVNNFDGIPIFWTERGEFHIDVTLVLDTASQRIQQRTVEMKVTSSYHRAIVYEFQQKKSEED